MKKILCVSLAAVLTMFALTGCRSKKPENTTAPTAAPTRPTTAPTTMPTTAPTTAPTTMPTTVPTNPGTGMPDTEDMLPGAEDTIDPSNGANQETGARRRNLR